jgi:hypothetical protein
MLLLKAEKFSFNNSHVNVAWPTGVAILKYAVIIGLPEFAVQPGINHILVSQAIKHRPTELFGSGLDSGFYLIQAALLR